MTDWNREWWPRAEHIIRWSDISEEILGDIEKFKFDREDVIRKFSKVLKRRFYFPDLPKDEIVGCGRIRRSPRNPPLLGHELPKGCSKSCKKEILPSRDKVPVECGPCEEDCSICLGPLSDDVVKTGCDHRFHKECLEKVKSEKIHVKPCPLCRSRVPAFKIDALRYFFDELKECRCCERHQSRRPDSFSGNATWVNDGGCGSDIAILLRKLLAYWDKKQIVEAQVFCKCRHIATGRSCRENMRAICKLL
jgi:hypothetical protein